MKPIHSNFYVRLFGVLLLFGVLCCGLASPIFATVDQDGSTTDTPGEQEEASGDGPENNGGTDGDPDEDSATIPDIAVQLILLLKRLGI